MRQPWEKDPDDWKYEGLSLKELIDRLDRDIVDLEKGNRAAGRMLTEGMRTLRRLAADLRRRVNDEP